MKYLRLLMTVYRWYLFFDVRKSLKNLFCGNSKLLRVVVEGGYLKAVNVGYGFFFIYKLRILVLLTGLHFLSILLI
jgi:hypothetical protein